MIRPIAEMEYVEFIGLPCESANGAKVSLMMDVFALLP